MRFPLLLLVLIPVCAMTAVGEELAPIVNLLAAPEPPVSESQQAAAEAIYLQTSAAELLVSQHGEEIGDNQTSRSWARGEYLSWWTDSMDTPPLVTTSPANTPRLAAGRLPAATVLFGGRLLDDQRSGGRFVFGHWLDDCRQFGFEGDYLELATSSDRYFADSTDPPILARPFFNVLTNAEDADLVAFDPLVNGSISLEAQGDFQSAGARMLWNASCFDGCRGGAVSDTRIDLMVGWRFLRLDESILIQEDLTSLPPDAGTFAITDRFETRNEFHGAEFGVQRSERCGRWSLDLLGRLAFGNVRQHVRIDGSTTSDEGMGPQTFVGGVLAQRTNIDQYTRNRFALAPELGATLGVDLTARLHATIGYTLICLERVVRPGDQMDIKVNPNLLPPESIPFSGPLRPAFEFEERGFWAHGLNLGLSYVW